MRMFLVIIALLMVADFAFDHYLEKGNVVGHHVLILTLYPDVTNKEWKEYMFTGNIPEFNKEFKGELVM